MNTQLEFFSLKFNSPAYYYISVIGKLNSNLLETLGVLSFEELSCGTVKCSTLSFYVKDQAQLSGILNALYNERYSILRVEYSTNEVSKKVDVNI